MHVGRNTTVSKRRDSLSFTVFSFAERFILQPAVNEKQICENNTFLSQKLSFELYVLRFEQIKIAQVCFVRGQS